MLAFGYEQQFSESLRYWRTRFIIIPSEERPESRTAGRNGVLLSDEEIRLVGMEKLADLFTKARWLRQDETLSDSYPPVRFLPTTLDPVACVMDEGLMAHLEQVHEAGPLKKKMNSNRVLTEIAKDKEALAAAMRSTAGDGVGIRDNAWHHAFYPDSFTGEALVSWMIREFQDVSTREQAAEWGAKMEQER